MKFNENQYYVVDVFDIKNYQYQRWHLLFIPSHRAYRIFNKEIYLHNIFNNHFYVTNIINVSDELECRNYYLAYTEDDGRILIKKKTLISNHRIIKEYKKLSHEIDSDIAFMSASEREEILKYEVEIRDMNLLIELETELCFAQYSSCDECPQCGDSYNGIRCYNCAFDWEAFD